MAQRKAEPRRTRRSPDTVQELILDAARSVFAEKGYRATSTREVAERAGVHEPMVYRRYATKAKLWEAAVVVPFNDVITSYLDTWELQAEAPSELETLVRAFVEPLFSLLLEHRELALGLVAAGDAPQGSDPDGEPLTALTALIERMTPQLEIEAARRALRVDSAATVVVSIGMVLGVALLRDVLDRSDQSELTSQRVLEEMVTYAMHAVSPPGPTSAVARTAATGDAPTSAHDVATVILQRLLETERRASRAEFELERLRQQQSAPETPTSPSKRADLRAPSQRRSRP